MKDEIKKYIVSETKLNEQTIHMRKIVLKICILLIAIGLCGLIFGLIMAII